MTIQTTASEIIYTANGSQTVFPIPFPYLEANDIEIILINPNGSTNTLTYGVDYTVASSNATLTVAPLVNVQVQVGRHTDAIQPVDLRAGDSFPEESIERALDRMTMLIQEILHAQNEEFEVTWGEITGVLSAQADLINALNAKLNVSGGTLTNYTVTSYLNHVHADAVCVKVKANEALVVGNVVKVVGWNAGEDAVEVVKVSSSSDIAFGVCHTNIAQGAIGTITNTGFVEGFDTSSFAVGTILYPNASGGFTATKPTSGNYQAIAFVLRSQQNNGTVFVEATEPLPVAYPSALAVKDVNSSENLTIWKGTQVQYDAVSTKNPTTIYFII